MFDTTTKQIVPRGTKYSNYGVVTIAATRREQWLLRAVTIATTRGSKNGLAKGVRKMGVSNW